MPHIHLANQNCSWTISTGLLVFKKKDKTVSPLKSSWWFSSLNRAWHQLWAGQLSAWAKQTCLNNATSGDVEGWLRESDKKKKEYGKEKTGGGRESRGGMWRKRVEMKKRGSSQLFWTSARVSGDVQRSSLREIPSNRPFWMLKPPAMCLKERNSI